MFRIPAVARLVVGVVRVVPTLVTVGFGVWAVAAAVAGNAALAAAAAVMGMLALSVAVRSAMSAKRL